MNGPRATNVPTGSSLMDKSTAKPGTVDMSIFEPKQKPVGQGTVSSDYQQRNQQDDPWPADQSAAKTPVSLSGCQFLNPETLAVQQAFEAESKVQWSGEPAPKNLRVSFVLKMSWEKDGNPTQEDGLEKYTGFLDASKKDQSVSIKGTLPRPPSFPPMGTKIGYQLVASHPDGQAAAESPVVDLVLKEAIHYAEVPDILFAHGGHFPCLDDEGSLVDALARSLRFAGETPKQQLVIFGHADTSGDHPVNYGVSDRRAEAAMALITQDPAIWVKLASHAKVEEIQRCLKTLAQCHGWPCDPGAVDDRGGPATQAAIKAFQVRCNQRYKLGLSEDGVAGPKTWKAVHRVICGLVAAELGLGDPPSAAYAEWSIPKLDLTCTPDAGHNDQVGLCDD